VRRAAAVTAEAVEATETLNALPDLEDGPDFRL